jgi:hypothetical protein
LNQILVLSQRKVGDLQEVFGAHCVRSGRYRLP